MGARRGGLAVDDFEKILAFGFDIAIDNDAHIRNLGVARSAAQKRMFAAFHITCRPRIITIIDRHAAVIFQYAPAHFGKQGFLQLFGRCQHGIGIGVLGFQMAANIGVKRGRILHHRLPIIIAQPSKRVGAGDAVISVAIGFFGRLRCALRRVWHQPSTSLPSASFNTSAVPFMQ